MPPDCERARRLRESLASRRRDHLGDRVRPAADHADHESCADCARELTALLSLKGAHFPEVPWVDDWPDETELENEAAAIARELVEQPAERRRSYLRSSDRAASRPLVKALIAESKARLSTDAARAVEIAELAVDCTDAVPEDRYDEPLWFDLKTLALANLSNAHRRSGDLRAAAEALAEAEVALLLGSENPSVVATVLQRRSRLARDLGRFDEALAAIDRAVELCRFDQFRHQRGVARYERSRVLASLERHEECLVDLRAALRDLDLEEDRRMGLVVFHAIAIRSTALGRLSQARFYLDEAVRRWPDVMNAGDRIRIAWARGRLEAAGGDLDAAGAWFAEVRDRFLALDYPLDAALATLELATILAERGRFRDVATLAAEMIATFRAVGVPRQALAAAYLLREAESVEAVRQVAAAMTRAKSSAPSAAPGR